MKALNGRTPVRTVILAASIAGAAVLLAGCSSGPAEGEHAAAARESMTALRDDLLAQAGAESPDMQEGTAPCDAAGKPGVDWTSYTEFDVLDLNGMERAEKLLVGHGYEVTHGSSEAFLASGPDGETITLNRTR